MNDKIFGFFYKEGNNNNNNYFARNFENIETIFDTRNYSSNSFVFSFDNDKIYFSDNSHEDSYENPGFSLKYNYKKSRFFGNEYINKKIDSNLYECCGMGFQNYPNIQNQGYENSQSMKNQEKLYTTTNTTNAHVSNFNNAYQNINNQKSKQIIQNSPNFSYTNPNQSSNQYYQHYQQNTAEYSQDQSFGGYGESDPTITYRKNINNDNSINSYILSKQEEFNIYNLEIYQII